MPKQINSFSGKNEKGFTLVEILVAMIILLLIVTAAFPLFTLATKTTHENKARMIAADLAAKQLELIISQVNASNFSSEDESAPLKTGVSDIFYFDENGNYSEVPVSNTPYSAYQGRKIVEWIDDPRDGKYPADKIPFDYKAVTIEVFSPSLFTGKIVKRNDFDTFIAREGTEEAIVGVIINVIRGWTDENAQNIPLENATVYLKDNNTVFASATTNGEGNAIIPLDITEAKEFIIEAEYSGMITNPADIGKVITVLPGATSISPIAKIEMEFPATLTIVLKPRLNDVEINLDGGAMGNFNELIGSGRNSITFENLWPAGEDPIYEGRTCAGGHYYLNIPQILIYDFLPGLDNATLSEMEEIEEDLWYYEPDYNGFTNNPAWVAVPGSSHGNTGTSQSLIFDNSNDWIDLGSYKPTYANTSAHFIASFQTLELIMSGASNDSTLIYTGNKNDIWSKFIALKKEASKWTLWDYTNNTLVFTGDSNNILCNNESVELATSFPENFKLRFDSDPSLEKFAFNNIHFYCQYEFGSIFFSGPGDSVTINVCGG